MLHGIPCGRQKCTSQGGLGNSWGFVNESHMDSHRHPAVQWGDPNTCQFVEERQSDSPGMQEGRKDRQSSSH